MSLLVPICAVDWAGYDKKQYWDPAERGNGFNRYW